MKVLLYLSPIMQASVFLLMTCLFILGKTPGTIYRKKNTFHYFFHMLATIAVGSPRQALFRIGVCLVLGTIPFLFLHPFGVPEYETTVRNLMETYGYLPILIENTVCLGIGLTLGIVCWPRKHDQWDTVLHSAHLQIYHEYDQYLA